ncbi:MAG: glycosyltransferase family 39 protein [bacterium]
MNNDNNRALGAPLNVVLALTVLAGAAARYWALDWGLPSELNIDETHFVPRAIKFGTGDLNPHFFLYPTLYMYMLFAAYAVYFVIGLAAGAFASASDFAIRYFLDPSPFYIIGRAMTATLSMLTALLVFAAARRLFGKHAAFAAAVFFLLSPMNALHSHFVTADVPVTFFMTLSLFFGLLMMETGARKYYLLAGFALGLAAAAKYTGILAAPALVLLHLLHAARGEGAKWKRCFLNANPYLMGAAAYAGFFAGCPFHVFDYGAFAAAVAQTRAVASGHWLGMEDVSSMWWRIIHEYLAGGVGAPVLALSVCGLVWAALSGNRGGAAVAFFALFYYLFLGRYEGHNFERYWLPITPALSVLAGGALEAFARRLAPGKPWAAALTGAAALALALLNSPRLYEINRHFSLPFTQNIAREWIEKNIPAGSRIALELHGPQPTGNLQSHLDAETRTYEPGDIVPEAEKFNVVGTALGDKRAPSAGTGKKYLSLALEKKEKQYYLYGVFSLGSHPMGYYGKNGYAYLISNSGIRDRYLAKPRHYPKTVEFYRALEREAELVKVFKPRKGKTVGPEIRIYRLRASP